MQSKIKYLSIFILFALSGLFACNNYDLPPQQELLLVETADREGLSLFVEAVNRAGLREALSDQGPFTVFAPSDEAFTSALQSLGISSLAAIPQESLAAILSYHVIPGRNISSLLRTGEVDTFLDNAVITIEKSSSRIILNDSIQVIQRDREALNGVIHVIDQLMLPPSNTILDVADRNNFTTFLNVVNAADLTELFNNTGPYTTFIPTNAAFTRYLNDQGLSASEFLSADSLPAILRGHAIDGVIPAAAFESAGLPSLTGQPIFISIAPNGAIWVNGTARVTATNLQADNGIVHVIDYVIERPQISILEKLNLKNEEEGGVFSILAQAVERAGLDNLLNRGYEENITLFAPTDEAFEEFMASKGISSLNDLSLEDLVAILNYHIVTLRAFSQDLREGANLPTLISGETLSVNLTNQEINDAPLLSNLSNIHGKNGVIHGIGKVLEP
ncbi:transforming growth factor-beta-induced protein [Belliella buryatensis]|uniref:Transforming growth factor-beta-induced protein n=1 Tax=Belliella buryatensis TaxID=1500549 RepID=A0A239EB44_9BACT|nr:fasciclin domain-containing protein [Belliella buryatensis]SNS41144.1 transforming growth factor-beta-induced protein [Belliella buryatensis]